jgi:pilus assembly protein CpaE
MSKTTFNWDPKDLDDENGFAAAATTEDDLDGFDFPDEPIEPPPLSEEESEAEWMAAPAAPISRDGGVADQPVPRITIHAYCDRPEIARLIQSVSMDRRLMKATTTVEMGGVDAAMSRLSAAASPNLIILDSSQPAGGLLRGLDRLAMVVDEGCKIIVIGAANDIGLYRELMKRGVSEYVVPPVDPVQLIRSIAALYTNPDKPFIGRVLSVIGAKGGVGASTVAHNLAWSLAERYEANTTLVDLDLSFGTTDLDFNQETNASVGDALLKADQIDEVYLERLLVRHSERLALLPAPAKLDREYDVDASHYEMLIDRVRRTSPMVVLDLPHIWTAWVKQTILSTDDLLIVTTPDLAGLRNAKNLNDLVRNARPHDPPPAVLLNMVGVPKRPEIPFKDFAEALGAEPVGMVPFDPVLFGAAANGGQVLLETQPGSKPGIALDAIARALCGREAPAKKKSSLLDRLPILKR